MRMVIIRDLVLLKDLKCVVFIRVYIGLKCRFGDGNSDFFY